MVAVMLINFLKLTMNLILFNGFIYKEIVLCVANIDDFCAHNYVDAVLIDRSTGNLVLRRDKLYATYDSDNQTVNRFIPKDYHYTIGAYNQLTTYVQSSFRLKTFPAKLCENQALREKCEQLSKLNNVCVSSAYAVNGNQFVIIDSPDTDNLTIFTTIDHCITNDISDPIFPKYIGCKNQIYKPSTYWPKIDLLIYIYNANPDTINSSLAVLATRPLISAEWSKGWNYRSINDSQHLTYVALFVWPKTDKVYAVIEKRNDRKRNGFIYEFNQNDANNPFIAIDKTVAEFFGCNKSPPIDHLKIGWICVIIVFTVIVAFVVISAIVYFVCTRKKSVVTYMENKVDSNSSNIASDSVVDSKRS